VPILERWYARAQRNTERKLLCSIQRQNVPEGLTTGVSVFVLWRLLVHLMESYFHVERDLAESGSMLVLFISTSILLPQFGWHRVCDRRETPRLRWLQNERCDRLLSRTRLVWIAGIILMLLSKLGLLLTNPNWPGAENGSDAVTIIIIGGGVGLLWRLPETMNEVAQAHYLRATQTAYLVTMLSYLSAVLLDSYWSDRLRVTIIISLLAGMLTQQIELALLGARTVPRDD